MFTYFEWLILVFPLLGTLLNGLLGTRFSRRAQNWIACGAVLGSLLVTLPLLAGQIMEPGLVGRPHPLPWIKVWSGNRFVEGPFTLLIDTLSIFMVLTILVVGLFIHLSAARRLDEKEPRHLLLALLNGSLTSLLILVLADNVLLLLLGWSLTGWCVHWLVQNWQGKQPTSSLARKQSETSIRTGARKREALPVYSLISDLCLLLVAGVISEQFASLSFYHVVALEPSRAIGTTMPGGLSMIVTLLLISAFIRATQFPFHVWAPERTNSIVNAFVYVLLSVLPSVYLLARLYPLVKQVSFGASLLSWGGAISAFTMALAALAQPDVHRLIRFAALGQGGLLFLALGQNAYPTAFSFLPAYALLQALIFLAAGEIPYATPAHTPRPTRPRKAVPIPSGARWTIVFGMAASVGLPLLPGFTFNSGLTEAAFYGGKGPWVLATAAVLLLAASAMRVVFLRASQPTEQPLPGRGILFVLALTSVIWGLLNLASPTPAGRFLEPIFGHAGYQPAWWWSAIITVVVGLGAASGYWLRSQLEKPPTGVMDWIARGYRVQDLYHTAIARPLLAAGQFIAEIDVRINHWTLGAVARLLVRTKPSDEKPNDSLHLSLLFFFLGTALAVAYLLMRC